MSTLKSGLIACITSLLCFNAFAATTTQVYTWTDKEGVVHYSETPPKNKEQTSQLVSTKTQAGVSSQATSPEDTETETEEKTATSQENVEQVLKKDPEACKQATKALNSLMSKPIIRTNGKIMTIEEKNQQLKNMKEIMKIHC